MSNLTLDALINAFLEGNLTAAEADSLSLILVENAAARQRFWQLAEVHGLLEQALRQIGTTRKPTTQRRWLAAAAAACVAALGYGYFKWLPLMQNSEQQGVFMAALASQFATVSNATADAGFSVGRRVQAGPLNVEKGRVEVTFDCGAVVEIIGPALLEMESEYRGFLHRGKLTVHVPKPAEGFIIQTPSSQIKDLGTAFGVEVAADGASEVHVLEGSVEARGTADGKDELNLVKESQAMRFTAATVEPTAYNGERFRTQLPVVAGVEPKSYAHWSLDTLQGSSFLDGSGEHSITPAAHDPLPHDDLSPQSRMVRGAFGKALRFNGWGEYAATTHSGFSGSTPRTVAFWVRLPQVLEPGLHNCMLSWGRSGAMSKWEMLWNQFALDGAQGALRLEFGQGYVIGSTDLRGGVWHHVAIVYHGEQVADVTTHIKIYVDGRLDVLTGRRPQRISTDTTSPDAAMLTLGRYIDYRSMHKNKYFQGHLDEIYVIEAALAPSEILTLKTDNRLPF